MSPTGQKLIFAGVVLLAVGTFFTGIGWGLPTRDSDSFLFGGRTPWTGEQIMSLAGAWDEGGNRGADIAMHPLDRRDQPLPMNDTDAKRAEIVRRYRLYSNQPDEMITFRSLARMKPATRDFDPRLYQYGGLWIYPIGGLLKLASVLKLIMLRTDLAFYLDQPDAFGRFYILARGYAAVWGLVGVGVVFATAREWTNKFSAGITAAAGYAVMPVVINSAHEAKPHLPGTVLTLLTIFAGLKFVRTGQSRWWVFAGISAGAAMGMVLTGYAAFAVLPVMTLLRPLPWRERMAVIAGAAAVGIAVFVLSNPYLIYDSAFNRAVLKSNVGNYGTFYRPGLSVSGLLTSGRLIVEGTSLATAVVGVIGVIGVIVLARRPSSGNPLKGKPNGLLLAAPAAMVLLQFVLLARGKPAEYARFAITFDVVLMIVAAALIETLGLKQREGALAACLLVGATLLVGVRYDLNCLIDNRADSSRRLAAVRIDGLLGRADTIAVWAEPAPYCMPPVDLFAWKILLLPKTGRLSTTGGRGVVSVRPTDERFQDGSPLRAASPIGWANKPFEIVGPSQ